MRSTKKRKFMYAICFAVTMILFASAFVSAYNLLCLKKGEIIQFSKCNPLMKNYVCSSDIYCSYCAFIGSNGAYCPAPLNKCNSAGLSCTSINDGNGTGPTIDRVPPKISTCSPVNGTVSSASRQIIKCSADETANWFYKDISGSSWKSLCSSSTSCMKTVSFDEGKNDILLKAVDRNGNAAQKELVFYIDSKKPKISKTSPKNGFSNGEFSVDFKEENPKSLVLYYGDKTKQADLTKCRTKNSKTTCDVTADVSSFDGQTISYWFELTDIANSVATSKKISLKVDKSAPQIMNPDSYWTQGTGSSSKYIYLNILINEKNFDSVEYSDNGKSFSTVCSSLKSGKCTKKLTFSRKGHHAVNLQITDEAGNSIGTSFEFDVA